ncbi:MAG: monooxygenase [Rhodospirillaceae bacterium]|jgi:hypothetical protein|nr:monooxygenase [Rhodospirillaceae bacterium]
MITAIVQFKVSGDTTKEQVIENMNNVAPKFESMPGLIRKNFLFDGENGVGGGVYTWETKEAAEAVYAEGGPWREAIKNLYGVDPSITWFETPIIVDNAMGEIKTAS